MSQQEIKDFFKNIEKLNLTKNQKKRMLKLFQVRGSNKKNKAMSFKEFVCHLNSNNGKIISLVLGPKWNRLIFVDIDIEV